MRYVLLSVILCAAAFGGEKMYSVNGKIYYSNHPLIILDGRLVYQDTQKPFESEKTIQFFDVTDKKITSLTVSSPAVRLPGPTGYPVLPEPVKNKPSSPKSRTAPLADIIEEEAAVSASFVRPEAMVKEAPKVIDKPVVLNSEIKLSAVRVDTEKIYFSDGSYSYRTDSMQKHSVNEHAVDESGPMNRAQADSITPRERALGVVRVYGDKAYYAKGGYSMRSQFYWTELIGWSAPNQRDPQLSNCARCRM